MASLEWEENVFVGIKALYRSLFVSHKEQELRQRASYLPDQRGMLLIVAKMLCGRDVVFFETADPVLYMGDRICLPDRIHLGPTLEANRECYILRTAVTALAIRFGAHADNSDFHTLLMRCELELPGLSLRIDALLENLGGRDLISFVFPRLPTQAELTEIGKSDLAKISAPEDTESKSATEIAGHGRVKVAEVNEADTGQQDTPFHTFEKVETLDEYNGLSRQNDAEDELLDHEEALEELTMDAVLRTQDRSESIYRADLMLDGAGFELKGEPGTGIPYPEWDFQRHRYRERWCFLHEVSSSRKDSAWIASARARHSALILTLKKRFASVISEWTKAKRHVIGNEFDIEAITELLIRLRTQESPPENLYLGRRRCHPEVATLILVDTSYSTDSWVANRRVLDVMKETVLCIADVMDDAQQLFGIYGFASNTRQNCRVLPIKRFDEPWRTAADALGGLGAAGYTRIGAALRHAYASLLPAQALKKLVILITDGKPCDYDRYEGKYGIQDVRKAIAEGRSKGIVSHAFAIDRQAREYFPAMFSVDDYDIVPHPEKLPGVLLQVYLKTLLRIS